MAKVVVQCPICKHNANSYDTLFNHIMLRHQKHQIAAALLNMRTEAKLTQLEAQIAEIKECLEELKRQAEG